MQQYLPWLLAASTLLVAVVVFLVWQAASGKRKPAAPPPLPTQWDLLPRPVFTADERRVYRQLREALPHHVVLAKLPLVRMCQPADPKSVRYWYNLLGSINVAYAVCSANGRVLAAVDISYDIGLPSRSTRIKQAVLAACRIRYLRCPVDQLPSIPELQLLVPHGTGASRTPQPMPAAAPIAVPQAATAGGQKYPTTPMGAGAGAAATANVAGPRTVDRATLWQESSAFMDSFFNQQRTFEPSGHGELRSMPTGHGDKPRMNGAPNGSYPSNFGDLAAPRR